MRWDEGHHQDDGPAGIACGVLLARRGKGLCELVDLCLYELGGEHKTWRRCERDEGERGENKADRAGRRSVEGRRSA